MKEKALTLKQNHTLMTITLKKGTSLLRIQTLLKELRKSSKEKGINTSKYCGKITLKNNPLILQKRMRDEWR